MALLFDADEWNQFDKVPDPNERDRATVRRTAAFAPFHSPQHKYLAKQRTTHVGGPFMVEY